MLLLCHGYHPAHEFVWAQCTCLKFSSCMHLWPVSFFFCVSILFFQLRLSSQSTYNMCCRSSTFVCTGQRPVRARVVLWSTPGLASMKHLAIFPSDTNCRGVFSILLIFFRHVFLQPEPTQDFMNKQTVFLPIRRRILLKIQKCQLWVRTIEWLKLNFASCVVHQTCSLDMLILYFIYN